MIRLFHTNHIRKIVELEGIWDFEVVDDANGEALPRSYKLAVPGCWEMHPELHTYRGKGIYRRKIEVSHQTSLRFVFKGVSHTANVFFDGQPIAEHYNAYTAFSAIVKNVEPGIHELSILVGNAFSESSALHIPNDYYTYGGIIRPVIMEEIGDLFIERIGFTPFQENNDWHAKIQVTVRNTFFTEQTFSLKGELAGESLTWEKGSISPHGMLTLSHSFRFTDIHSWSSATPNLYELNVRMFTQEDENPLDDLIERVGFRTVTTRNGKIQVNGSDIVFKGFNRHEDHPLVGPAFPLSLMVNDLDLMVDMGANAVRTSHYPNDERFLDLCDERGIYVWEENHARGLSLIQMQNPNFAKQCEDVNREMVEQHVNHPSIIIWAILNECASDTVEGREMYRVQLEQIRSMDVSRPLSFASHHRNRELCFDLADIVSVNLYPLWYGSEDPHELCEQARRWADEAGGLGKPMIMSEFGADGFYGYRDPSHVKGTEERQAEIIERNLAAYSSSSFISGMFIWQFCDCRVTEGDGWLLTRAGTQNSKGIVDRYRRPKLAYTVVKKYYKNI